MNFYDLYTDALEKVAKNVPTSPEKWARAKAMARAKFDIYPSAYANGFAAKKYKEMGGGWKKAEGGSKKKKSSSHKKEAALDVGGTRLPKERYDLSHYNITAPSAPNLTVPALAGVAGLAAGALYRHHKNKKKAKAKAEAAAQQPDTQEGVKKEASLQHDFHANEYGHAAAAQAIRGKSEAQRKRDRRNIALAVGLPLAAVVGTEMAMRMRKKAELDKEAFLPLIGKALTAGRALLAGKKVKQVLKAADTASNIATGVSAVKSVASSKPTPPPAPPSAD